MVDQTQVDGAPRAAEAPPRAVARNTAELFSDVLTLAELQGKLLLVDLESSIWRIVPPAISLLAGVVLAGSCVPIALATAALALVEYVRFTPAQGFALSLLGGSLVSLALLGAAVWQLRAGMRFFERSQIEWKHNLRWLKSMLKRMDEPRPHRYDSLDKSRW